MLPKSSVVGDAAAAAASEEDAEEGAHGAAGGYPGATVASDSQTAATPLLDGMYTDGLMNEDVFSIAFCSNDAAFAIGGIDESRIVGNVSYVTTQKTYGMFYGYYLAYLESVRVDGVAIEGVSAASLNSLGGVLVDSGTTLLYLPSAITSSVETKVAAAVLANGGADLSQLFFSWMACVSTDALADFPTVTLALSGYDLELTPRDYLLHYGDCYYWGIAASSIGIIGNIALQNKMVIFDRAENEIGRADANCGADSGQTTVGPFTSAAGTAAASATWATTTNVALDSSFAAAASAFVPRIEMAASETEAAARARRSAAPRSSTARPPPRCSSRPPSSRASSRAGGAPRATRPFRASPSPSADPRLLPPPAPTSLAGRLGTPLLIITR